MRFVWISIFLVGSLIWVGNASAQVYPGHTAPELTAQINIALSVWDARGIHVSDRCPDTVVGYFTDSVDGANGRGLGCEEYLPSAPIYTDGTPVPGGWGKDNGAYFASVVEHETGHALGLSHEDAYRFPIMTPSWPLPAAGDHAQDVVVKAPVKIKKKHHKRRKRHRRHKSKKRR
jgi:hypothetical protein